MNKLAEKIKPYIFYITTYLFILAISFKMSYFDYDLWARLIVGKYVIQTGHVLKQDFLSYTPTHTWYDHEWLSGVVFYVTQHYLGSFGLIALHATLLFAVIFIITKIIKLRGVKTSTPYNFLFFYYTIGAISYIFMQPTRCQLFTFLFFSVFLYLLELSRKQNKTSKFSLSGDWGLSIYLPLMMIVWNNLHGGCVSGLGLISIYLIGEFLNKNSIKKYLYALILSSAVLVINPWGPQYLTFLLSAVTMQRQNVTEWWGVFDTVNQNRFFNLKISMFLLISSNIYLWIKNFKQNKFNVDKTKLLVIIATLFLGIKHLKLIPLFVISGIAFMYDDFYTAFNSITFNFFNKYANIKDFLIYICIYAFICGNLMPKSLANKNYISVYPYQSVEFVKKNNLKGNILSNFGLGSYISYKLYPNNKIFMDGRYEEVYYDYMLPLLKDFYLANKNGNILLKKYPPDIMIIEKYYPIYKLLKTDKNWALVYDKEKDYGVFVKRKDLKRKYINPDSNIQYYNQTLFNTDIDFISLPIAR